MHLLRMSCKCCALLGAAAVLLLLSLLGRGAGSKAPAEPEEPTQQESCFAKRLGVNLEAVDAQHGSTKLKPMPVVWEASQEPALISGRRPCCGGKQLLMPLHFVGWTAAWP